VAPRGVKLKLLRASEQLASINEAIRNYADQNVGPMLLDGELDGLESALRLPTLPALDENIAIDIGEFLHNLRSALDQTTYAMLQAKISNLPDISTSYREKLERASQFPITDDAGRFAEAGRQIAGLSPAAKRK
jgi:hypothetical protein